MVSLPALKAPRFRLDLDAGLTFLLKKIAPHPFSLRFSLGLWAGSSLAFFLAFLFQLDTPQWAGVSVWIMFMQSPRLNYSKVLFWMAGTCTGAVVATVLIEFFSQTPELFLLMLALWLAVCAALATQVREYRAYGAVLAGYTCAIVSFTGVNQPDQIFEIAVTRVSCVTLGIACAMFAMTVFLPKHRHWKQTLHLLHEHGHRVLQQSAAALATDRERPGLSSWGHMVERLSTLEHTFDFTLAESADSRARSAQTRCLTASLFCLAAKAQAIEFHLSHAREDHSPEVREALRKTQALIEKCAADPGLQLDLPLVDELAAQRAGIESLRAACENQETSANRFLLDQLHGMLVDVEHVMRDRAGLHGPWSAPRPSSLGMHRERLMGALYALRIFLAMGLATAFWFASEWPSGSSFLLFLAIVCSLLSLLDHAEHLGTAYLKSVTACFIASFIELFWILQKGEGFLFFCLAMGLFLAPAAYAYTHPRLAGSAVISMLLFYGLVSPANMMTYDITLFLNNALAFLAAAAFGFFAFHVVRSPSPPTRQRLLLRSMRKDLHRVGDWKAPLREQHWASLSFDRLRILHRFGSGMHPDQMAHRETLLHLGLLWGLRQMGLRRFLEKGLGTPDANRAVRQSLKASRHSFEQPAAVAREITQAAAQLEGSMETSPAPAKREIVGALAELREMALLLQTSEALA